MSNNKVLYAGNFHGKVDLQFALGVTADGKIYYRNEKGSWSLYATPIPTPDIPTLLQVLTASTITGLDEDIVLTDGTISISNGIITGFTPAP